MSFLSQFNQTRVCYFYDRKTQGVTGGSRSAEAGRATHRHVPRLCCSAAAVGSDELGSYYYGSGHPMKPQRLRMTHSLLLAYGLYKKMEVYRPHPAQQAEMERFHSADYINFLRRVTPDNAKDYLHQLQKCNTRQREQQREREGDE